MKHLSMITFICLISLSAYAANAEREAQYTPMSTAKEYTIGVDDVLDITVARPEQIKQTVSVAPDGMISFPYIGSIAVKGKTLTEIQSDIESRLSDGYMKYPLVTVSLIQSLSRKFFVYGEVIKPGNYPMTENTTVLRAISIAGGFTRFGSSSKVKVLRENTKGTGYSTIKVNIKEVMDGDASQDLVLVPGDIVVVSEGVFK